jgi:hypothetical protein
MPFEIIGTGNLEMAKMATKTSLKKMSSNGMNAKKSTGPRNTVSTRYNAVRHGLLSKGLTELDDHEQYRHLKIQLEKELLPQGAIEDFLVESIALCIVRLKRSACMEAEYITECLNPKEVETKVIYQNPLSQISQEFEDKVETMVVDPGLPARVSPGTVQTLGNLYQRYETTIENRLIRLSNQLERIQGLRGSERITTPVAVDVTVQNERPR